MSHDVDVSMHVCRLVFPSLTGLGQKRKKGDDDEDVVVEEEKPCLVVEPYRIPNRGPYPFNQPKK